MSGYWIRNREGQFFSKGKGDKKGIRRTPCPNSSPSFRERRPRGRPATPRSMPRRLRCLAGFVPTYPVACGRGQAGSSALSAPATGLGPGLILRRCSGPPAVAEASMSVMGRCSSLRAPGTRNKMKMTMTRSTTMTTSPKTAMMTAVVETKAVGTDGRLTSMPRTKIEAEQFLFGDGSAVGGGGNRRGGGGGVRGGYPGVGCGGRTCLTSGSRHASPLLNAWSTIGGVAGASWFSCQLYW